MRASQNSADRSSFASSRSPLNERGPHHSTQIQSAEADAAPVACRNQPRVIRMLSAHPKLFEQWHAALTNPRIARRIDRIRNCVNCLFAELRLHAHVP